MLASRSSASSRLIGWLRRRDVGVEPEEVGGVVAVLEGDPLRTAFVRRLIVISNDPLVGEDLVYELSISAEDLAAFSWEFSGINALLLPQSGIELAVLFSTDDYYLVAGTRQFVTDYAGT
jgi:hypothetical protein